MIALGSIIILLINPNVTMYDFYLFIPAFFYLVTVINFNHFQINQDILKYVLIISCIVIQDINLPFFLSTLSFFYIIFNSFKNIDSLGFNFDKR